MTDTTVRSDRIDAALVADEVLLTNEVLLTVDCGQSLEVMIAAGHYDWTNPDITAERFPMEGTGAVPVEAKLFHFNRFISSENAVAAIKTYDVDNPWEPAKIEHLLAFGATHPDEQRRYPIAALGSAAEVLGLRYVPCLDEYSAKRRLHLFWWINDWNGYYRFLAVRNLSSGA